MVLEEHFFGSKVSTTLVVPFSVSDGCCTREIAVPWNWWNLCCDLYYLQQQL